MGATGDVYVEFSAKVPRALFDQFDEIVPIYGSRQWFLCTALAAFVEEAKRNPGVVEQVKLSVQSMVTLNRLIGASSATAEENKR
jgi:hypothetical protein